MMIQRLCTPPGNPYDEAQAHSNIMRIMRSKLSAACIALVSFGCSTGTSSDADEPGDFAAAQQRWEAAALTDYRFDFEQQCFCVREQVQPVTIEVRDGRIVRVVSRETGEELTAVEGLQWRTIPDLFRVISDARQDEVTPLTVQYDPELGYPAHIEAGSLAADAGVIYTVSNLAAS